MNAENVAPFSCAGRRHNAQAPVSLIVAVAACVGAAVAHAQDSATVRWRTFTNARWGFAIQLPADWRVEFSGPVHAGCSSASRDIVVRPSWVAASRADGMDTIAVSFVRASFDELAHENGFSRVGATWFDGSDSAHYTTGDHWQAVEGQDVERVDHPDATPGEPSFDFDMVFRAIARFDRGRECALMLVVREVGHVSEDESVADLWPRARVLRRGPR